jgi:hypothetical protein
MLASFDWRVRHAGLMAIAAIGEGTGKVKFPFSLFVHFSVETAHVGHAKRTWKNRRVRFSSLICQFIILTIPSDSSHPCSQTPIRASDTLHVSVCKSPLSLCPPTNDSANTLCLVVSGQLCTDLEVTILFFYQRPLLLFGTSSFFLSS